MGKDIGANAARKNVDEIDNRPLIKQLTVAGELNGFDTNHRNNVVAVVVGDSDEGRTGQVGLVS